MGEARIFLSNCNRSKRANVYTLKENTTQIFAYNNSKKGVNIGFMIAIGFNNSKKKKKLNCLKPLATPSSRHKTQTLYAYIYKKLSHFVNE